MITADLHIHTIYSHGKCTVREVAEAALKYGLSHIAISEHCTANMFYGLSAAQFDRLFDEIDALKDEFANQGLHILRGVELNMLGNGKTDMPSNSADFQVTVMGYHRGILPKSGFACRALAEAMGLGSGIRQNTEQFIRAIEENRIDIIAHPGEYIKLDIPMLAKAAARLDTLLEINNRHVTLNRDELRAAADCGAKFIISSDSHTHQELCRYERAIHAANDAGVLSAVVNWEDDGSIAI